MFSDVSLNAGFERFDRLEKSAVALKNPSNFTVALIRRVAKPSASPPDTNGW
jgi:hypothetical protein